MAGYLVTTFNDQQPGIFQYLSKGNDAFHYQPLNGGKPILKSDILTGGSRDPFLFASPDHKAFWILATDLDISKTSWLESQKYGSRSIIAWSSTDMIHWTKAKAFQVEGPEAGFVWAPSVIQENDRYTLFWSSRIYEKSDIKHEKVPLYTTIRYTTTKDFITFDPPKNYIEPSKYSKIDQEFLALEGGEYLRFLKDESRNFITTEKSKGGLFGQWTQVGSSISEREGPLAFLDNKDSSLVHLWADRFGGPQGYGYDSYESHDPINGNFKPTTGQTISPNGLRHGTVTPLTEEEYK